MNQIEFIIEEDDDVCKTVSKVNKIELFKELANFDPTTNESRFVNVAEFTGKYTELRFGNGGGWSRLDGDFGKKNKICIVKTNGDKRFSWNPDAEEEEHINLELAAFGTPEGKGKTIMLIKFCGKQNEISGRPIRKDIRNALLLSPCVVCGTNSQIEIDHKNGLYKSAKQQNPDRRRLSTALQTLQRPETTDVCVAEESRQKIPRINDTTASHFRH